ncbi:MAG: aldolase/citrate lyase family protein [Chloroflexota bacterium]
MRTNNIKAKMSQGKVVFGAIVNDYSPATVELFGAIGFDFVFIDCEHGPMSVDQVENMVRAAEVFNITPIARIPNHDDSTILRFLDRGVQGIIVPHCNTRAQAEAIAKAARYYPEGHRGSGGGRPHDYGIGVTRDQSIKWVNSQTLVMPMVEEVEAVKNLDEILKVPGIDLLHVASGDLGQSMGNAPQAEVWKVMDAAIPKIRAAGKWVGIGGNNPSDIARLAQVIKLGANFITISAQGLMRLGAEDFRKKIQAAL